MSTVYYPKLSLLVPVDALPEALGFVKDGIESLLGGLYFKDLEHSASPRGDAANYGLTIVSAKTLEIEILGTGIFLVLNPDHESGKRSEFPITVGYEWGILTWVRKFDVRHFSFDPAAFYQLALSALGLTERQLLDRALGVFIDAPSPIDRFVDDVNAFYGSSIPHPVSTDPIGEVATALENTIGKNASIAIFAVYVVDNLDLQRTEERLEAFLGGLFGGSLKAYFLKLITPRINATLQIGAGLRFPRDVLLPLDEVGGQPLDEPAASILRFDAGTFSFSTEEGIGYDETLTASLTPSQIGNTGFEIAVSGARLDLSRTTNIPEATADGRPDDFVGVFIEEATVKLPSFFQQDEASSARLVGSKLLIGTGGLSGTIALKAVNPADTTPALVKGKFGSGFEIGLSAVSVSFKQNTITTSEIRGYMLIPGFKDTQGNDAEVQITVNIGSDGNFSVTASEEQGIRALSIPEVVDVEIDSLSVGRKKGRFFVAVSGALVFTAQDGIGQFLPDKLDIKKLIIWDDGQIELEGGKLKLPRAVSLKAGPVNLSVTAIGFGSHEQEHKGHLRQYKYFTFDGAISVNPGGVDASGNGIAFYYTVDNDTGLEPHRFLRIQSIAVDLVIPGSAPPESAMLLLKGYLSMQSSGTEYAGSVAFTLPKLDMSGAAAMRLNPSVPAFIIDVGLEMATPILLGSTNLGIWGFRGLLGLRYVASKQSAGVGEGEPWWKYYKAKIATDFQEGIQVSKFAPTSGFSLGAGVSLATVSDTGYAFSSKIFFLLSLPEVFLLQGQGQILKGRILLTDKTDPPFFALISITKTSVESAFGVKYAIPAEATDGKQPGGIATVDGVIEMGFFWGSSAAWYINIGRAEPANQRILVRLLSIVDAYFYFMMSGAGIRAGAGASYRLSKKFGPLKAELSAYLDAAGRVSFRPSQIGASIRIGGNVDLSIFGFGFGVSAAASLAAEGTKPYTISGSFEVCVRVLRKNRCARFEFTWIFNTDLDLSEIRLLKENLRDSGKALNIHTHETYELWTGTDLPDLSSNPTALDAHMIPLDSYIDIEFTKGVKPSPSVISAFGGNTMGSDYIEYVPPQRGKSDRVRHEYSLDSVEILYYDGRAWKPYDIYGAATPPQLEDFITSDPSTLKQGFWQYQQPNLHNKLRVLAQSPLTYVSQGSGAQVMEDSGITVESIFCAPDPIAESCTGFDDFQPVANTPVALAEGQRYFHHRFQFRILGAGGNVVVRPAGGHTRAVRVDAGTAIEIFLIEPAVSVRLALSISTDTAVVRFYQRVPVPPSRPGLPATQYDYALVGTRGVAPGALVEVRYDHITQPVDKIVIDAGVCSLAPPLVCDATVSQQGRDLERFLDTLIRRGEHLSHAVELYHRDDGDWDGIFFHTSLYPPPVQVFARYSLLSVSGTQLRGTLTDWRGFACPLELTLIEGAIAIDWQSLAGVHHLRPDDQPHVPGPNYTFLIDGDVLTPAGVSRVTLRGSSCYPIIQCRQMGDFLPGPVTDGAVALGDLLALLTAGNRLAQPRLALASDEMAAFDRMFPRDGSPPARKVWLIVSAPEAQRLDATFDDKGSGGKLSLALPFPRDGFSFDQVIGLTGLRPDVANLTAGPNQEFLIDARVRGANGESTVTLRGEAPFTVTTAEPIRPPDEGGDVVQPLASAISPPAEKLLHEEMILASGTEGCGLYLYEVCVLDLPSAAFNATLPTQSSVDAEVASIVNAFQGSIQPLWRPNTCYAIRVKAADRVSRESSPSGTAPPKTHVYGFRTVGPLGHFHIYPDGQGQPVPRPDYAALEAAGRSDEFKLVGLLHYVDFAKCYPNADGQLINAKPLFYDNPRLLLFYLQTYVARMFCDWAPWGDLEAANAVFEVLVKDPAPDPEVPEAAAVEARWALSPVPLVSRDVAILNNMITYGTPCGTVSVIEPTWLYSDFELETRLEPLKLYTAIFSLRFKNENDPVYVRRELLRYGFQTSRYANLSEQVDSYKLKVDPNDGTVLKTALFETGRAFAAADLALAAGVLDDTMPAGDPLRQTFADPFNRLIEGALKLEAIHPPRGTELNVVRDTATGRVLGLLVKNPEPFNDPKLPPSELIDSIRLSVNGGDPALYKALHSKDLSQAFLTNADNSMSLPAGATLDLTFDCKQWDGSVYAAVDTANLSLVLP